MLKWQHVNFTYFVLKLHILNQWLIGLSIKNTCHSVHYMHTICWVCIRHSLYGRKNGTHQIMILVLCKFKYITCELFILYKTVMWNQVVVLKSLLPYTIDFIYTLSLFVALVSEENIKMSAAGETSVSSKIIHFNYVISGSLHKHGFS